VLLRTNVLIIGTCLALLRGEGLCTCVDDEPCQYEETPLAADAETLWGTTPAEDIANLEIPQHGTWRWGESKDFVEVDDSGVELPAWATFVHDPETIRFSEHVDGGRGVACNGPTVSVDGTLTITDDQGAVIVSLPITALRQFTADLNYVSGPEYSPASLFSDRVHETAEWDIALVWGAISWLEEHGLHAEFYYYGQRMNPGTTENGTATGNGVVALVGEFVADGPP
jgi:hypothetical protein